MLKLFLWLRYLRKKKIALLSIGAVALSCALLIVVASLFTGVVNAAEKSAAAVGGDIAIYPPHSFRKYGQFIKEVEQIEQVEAATANIWGGWGLLRLGSGDVREVLVIGVEPDRESNVSGLRESLLGQGNKEKHPGFEVGPDELVGFVGIRALADPNERTDEFDLEQVQNYIGKSAVLISRSMISAGLERGTQGDDNRRMLKVKTSKIRIADVSFTGVYWRDQMVYLPIAQVQKLSAPNISVPVAEVIRIRLKKDTDPVEVKEKVQQAWESFAAEELGWERRFIGQSRIYLARDFNGEYLAEVRKQMGVLMLILGIICSVGVLLIFCIFYMIVITKQKDIAIVKSCGASNFSVASVFLWYGVCIGIIGSVLGTGAGYAITKNINTLEHWLGAALGMKIWRSSVYALSQIPNQVDWYSAWWIALAAIAASVVGALIPAIVAARTRPVVILRYE